MRVLLIVCVLCCINVATNRAQAGIVNGDFETGDTTGWTLSDVQGYGPADLSIIDTGGGNHALRLLLPGIGKYHSVVVSSEFDTPEYLGNFSYDLTLTITSPYVDAGSYWLSGLAFFDNYLGLASQSTIEKSVSPLTPPARVSHITTFISKDNIFFYQTPIFALAETEGASLEAIIDNVKWQHIAPEPSTLALGLLGFAVIGLAARRKRR